MLRNHSPLTKFVLTLVTLTTSKPKHPVNNTTALGTSRQFLGLSELWVLSPSWRWSSSLLFPQNMPRRRVSVAVVPKFNALNLPGQSPSSSPIPSLPALVSMMVPASQPSGSLLWGDSAWGRVNQERKFPVQILGYELKRLNIDKAMSSTSLRRLSILLRARCWQLSECSL